MTKAAAVSHPRASAVRWTLAIAALAIAMIGNAVVAWVTHRATSSVPHRAEIRPLGLHLGILRWSAVVVFLTFTMGIMALSPPVRLARILIVCIAVLIAASSFFVGAFVANDVFQSKDVILLP